MLVGHENRAKGVTNGEEYGGDEHDTGHVDDLWLKFGVDFADSVWD